MHSEAYDQLGFEMATSIQCNSRILSCQVDMVFVIYSIRNIERSFIWKSDIFQQILSLFEQFNKPLAKRYTLFITFVFQYNIVVRMKT